VCSPTDEYRRFTNQGCGNIAHRGREWTSTLRRLIQSPAMRAEQAEAGREVASRWVMEDHVDRYVEAWAGVAVVRDTAPMATTERTP